MLHIPSPVADTSPSTTVATSSSSLSQTIVWTVVFSGCTVAVNCRCSDTVKDSVGSLMSTPVASTTSGSSLLVSAIIPPRLEQQDHI